MSDVASDGMYLAGSVVVNDGGILRGFYNVCHHHAVQLFDEGTGTLPQSRRIRCPCHGLEYTTG